MYSVVTKMDFILLFAGCLKVELIDHTGIISDLSFAPDGSLCLVSASHDSTLKIWDFEEEGNLIKTLKAKAKIVFGCAWSPNSKMLASVGDRKTVSDHSAGIQSGFWSFQ